MHRGFLRPYHRLWRWRLVFSLAASFRRALLSWAAPSGGRAKGKPKAFPQGGKKPKARTETLWGFLLGCGEGRGASMEKCKNLGVPANEGKSLLDMGPLLASINMYESETSDTSVYETEKPKELEEWKEKVAKAEKQKDEMLFLKLTADEKEKKLQDKLKELKDVEIKMMERRKGQEDRESKLSLIKKQNNELRKEIGLLKSKLDLRKAQHGVLAWRHQLRKYIPEKKMKCTRLKNDKTKDMCMNISYFFQITPKIPFKLHQGEALITFEEESVADELIRKQYHLVNMENEEISLQALPVTLETGITFELHVKISQKKIQIFDVPDLKIPDDWMRDKLELCLRRTKLGADVENIVYDHGSKMALITFAQPLAVNDIVKSGQYPFQTSDWIFTVMVSPVIQSHLEKFQIFSGISRKTILLKGIQTKEEDDENVQDMIAIHFQKARNGGGEVENVRYLRKGTKMAYFENDNEGDII